MMLEPALVPDRPLVPMTLQFLRQGLARRAHPLLCLDEITDRLEVGLRDQVSLAAPAEQPRDLRVDLDHGMHDLIIEVFLLDV